MALLAVLAIVGAGCSREQQDWRSAESAATSEAWARFVEQHPESELAAQARDRIAQLAEQREWQRAESLASADAYREFVARHPTGKWSEEARIRIEAFALGSAPRIAPQTAEEAAANQASGGVRALALAAAAAPVVLVANDVGSGVVPDHPLGRKFRDLQGMLNQRIAARADHVVLMVAGLPLALKGALKETP